ncbi:helix-turn-helix transcriptional regulator [Aerolutibacter ruishenii]|uniref:Putative ArsR family transcriptional regulator n=1 Tax=Aerolutibacter ruishenii TaxID=686800 RepID=A0A562LCF9_9GAMM|nr:MarR family transcriptional regulator [Lysobacter ruishenii]TWI05369.1 putative ArsR family transcriptional regulator [Lysobacter ruishenii]
MAQALHRLGDTQQRLLRQLLLNADGCTVETLCERLHVSHNAVRQHLTALIGHGWIERMQSLATGGRPQMRYALTNSGHELFPRNYGAIAGAMLAQLYDHLGDADAAAFLDELGRKVAATQPALQPADGPDGLARALARRLDDLGYETVPARHGTEWQVEAFNCVFHAVARQHPQVCRFDLALMEAATGHRIHHMECIARGGHVCRFRIGELLTPSSGSTPSA